ncbi:MAG: GTP cyclohydrolase II [Pyrinomonadaceae bacterium]|nr:GTP cyclohydrolase II [Pyrinomonadaceae bacterium]
MLTSVQETQSTDNRAENRFAGSRRASGSRAIPISVERVAESRLPIEWGEFRIIGYRSLASTEEFVALVRGELRTDTPTLARIHSQCMTGDVFGSVRCDCGRQLHAAMRLISAEGAGLIVYQQQEGRGIGIINKIRAYALQDEGADTVEANELLGLGVDLRKYDQCAEIFFDLGLRKVRFMSNNPSKIQALEKAGLEVVERVRLEVEPHEGFSRYLKTKRERMGHLIHAA